MEEGGGEEEEEDAWTWFLTTNYDSRGTSPVHYKEEDDEDDEDEDYLPQEEENEEDDYLDGEGAEDLNGAEKYKDDHDDNGENEEPIESHFISSDLHVWEQPTRLELPVLRARISLSTVADKRKGYSVNPAGIRDHEIVATTMPDSNDVEEDIIATRTRQHWDLSKVTIDDLDTILDYTPVEAVLQDYDETYLSFLNSLRDDHHTNQDDNHSDGSTFDDDYSEAEDEDYVYEQPSSETLSDEFRYDTSVQIPRGELQDLLKEACHESYFKEIFENSGRAKEEEDDDNYHPLSSNRWYPFNEDLLKELTGQFKSHVQLLLQTYALGGLFDGELRAAQAAQFFLEDLYTRKREWKQTLVLHGLATEMKGPLELDCLDVVLSLKTLEGEMKTQFYRNQAKWTRSKYVLPPPVFYQCLNLMKDDRDDNLMVPIHIESNFRIRFTNAEKELLYWGTLRFGIGNWEVIQRELLPGKTPLQVKTLYKNLQSSRVPDNPMKELSRYLRQPLNDREKKVLQEVVEHYGPQFDAISMFFLPHRTPAALRKAWYELSKKDIQIAQEDSAVIEEALSSPPSTPPSMVVHYDEDDTHRFADFQELPHSDTFLTRQETLLASPRAYDTASSPLPLRKRSTLIRVRYLPSPKRDVRADFSKPDAVLAERSVSSLIETTGAVSTASYIYDTFTHFLHSGSHTDNLSMLLEEASELASDVSSRSTGPALYEHQQKSLSPSLTMTPTTASLSSSSSTLLPQNRLTIDHGLTYVHFSREEDRHLLMTARRCGASSPDIWSLAIASRVFSPDKTWEHLSARYLQLHSWMMTRGFSKQF